MASSSSSTTPVYMHLIAQGITLLFVVLTTVSVIAFKGKPVLNIANVSYTLIAISVIALIAAAYLLGKSRTFLPFLGDTAFPSNVLILDDMQGAEALATRPLRVTINVPEAAEGSIVVYWASNPETSTSSMFSNPRDAYANTKNAGATRVQGGCATLMLACPSQYKVMGGRALKRHVHYRVQGTQGSGMFGPVKTIDVHC